jgi:hypothetical protein
MSVNEDSVAEILAKRRDRSRFQGETEELPYNTHTIDRQSPPYRSSSPIRAEESFFDRLSLSAASRRTVTPAESLSPEEWVQQYEPPSENVGSPSSLPSENVRRFPSSPPSENLRRLPSMLDVEAPPPWRATPRERARATAPVNGSVRRQGGEKTRLVIGVDYGTTFTGKVSTQIAYVFGTRQRR